MGSEIPQTTVPSQKLEKHFEETQEGKLTEDRLIIALTGENAKFSERCLLFGNVIHVYNVF